MQKLVQATCLALATFGLSAVAHAFTVENMSAWSMADQPLRMDIELSGLAVAYASEVQVRVASDEDHARLGLTRPSWANNVRFQMITLPNYRVVARAMTTSAISDNPVSFVVEIRTPSEGRLQQVGSALGLQPIAAKNPAPERTVAVPHKAKTPGMTVVEPAAEAKAYTPRVESLVAEPTKPQSAPAASAKAESAKVMPAKSASVQASAANTRSSAPAQAPAKAIAVDDRAALEAGLKAAKAQVADLEAQLAALAAAETASAPEAAASDMSLDATVAAMVNDEATASSETTEASPIEPTADEIDNNKAVAVATGASDDSLTPVQAVPLKPYELFARVMILFVGLILLVFFLLDKVRNRR